MTNYKSGVSLEYKVIEKLRDKYELVFRSAGSHSLVDVMAVGIEEILLIQCKKTSKNTIDLKQLFNENSILRFRDLEVASNVKKLLAIKQKISKGITFFVLENKEWKVTNI